MSDEPDLTCPTCGKQMEVLTVEEGRPRPTCYELSLLRNVGVEQRGWDHRDASAASSGRRGTGRAAEGQEIRVGYRGIGSSQADSVHELKRGPAAFHIIFERPPGRLDELRFVALREDKKPIDVRREG